MYPPLSITQIRSCEDAPPTIQKYISRGPYSTQQTRVSTSISNIIDASSNPNSHVSMYIRHTYLMYSSCCYNYKYVMKKRNQVGSLMVSLIESFYVILATAFDVAPSKGMLNYTPLNHLIWLIRLSQKSIVIKAWEMVGMTVIWEENLLYRRLVYVCSWLCKTVTTWRNCLAWLTTRVYTCVYGTMKKQHDLLYLWH